MAIKGYVLDGGGPKDSENTHNSFLTKRDEDGFWQIGTDMIVSSLPLNAVFYTGIFLTSPSELTREIINYKNVMSNMVQQLLQNIFLQQCYICHLNICQSRQIINVKPWFCCTFNSLIDLSKIGHSMLAI